MGIIAQAAVDHENFIAQVNSFFDPDQATGTILDARVAINGLVRNPGTYTQQTVQVTTIGAAVLQGLDIYPNAPFTVADGQGNQYQLEVTTTISGAGTTSLVFQAAQLGPISSGIGTITNIVTPTQGVSSVSNSTGPSTVGTSQETDSQLRIRRANSVALPSKGWLQGLEAGILAVDGVQQVVILENTSNSTDGNGIPGHSIWIIVSCPPTSYAGVAQAIYVKRNAGCGFKNGGAGAVATATVSGGGVTGVTVTNPGIGFYVAPTVSFISSTGHGATATSTVNSEGQITGVSVVLTGTGYGTPPQVLFNWPNTIQTMITQVDGSQCPIVFDIPVQDNLYFTATVDVVPGGTAINLSSLAQQIANSSSFGIGQTAVASEITALIMSLYPQAVVSNATVAAYSLVGPSVTPSGPNHQFVLPVANITLSS